MGEETCPRQWGFRFFYRLPSPRRIQTWQAPPSNISKDKLSLKYLVEKCEILFTCYLI